MASGSDLRGSVLPPPEICERARLARDPRFDGRFFVAVVSTGVYCRPVCPARPPHRENVRYFPTAAAAQAHGFRPCLRCRPEAARRLPEWTVASATVVRGLRLIDGGFLADRRTGDLAAELGIGVRHLNRLFRRELGASPAALARARRLALAKRLIDETPLGFAHVAAQAGYGSVRRFNVELKRVYGRTPRALRRLPPAAPADEVTLELPVREPYNANWVFEFLAKRALAGVEEVTCAGGEHRYRRRLGTDGWVTVTGGPGRGALAVTLPAGAGAADVLTRVRRVFDLDADPVAVDSHLRAVPELAPAVRAAPGIRVPGAWDGFETAVRAILGQQVSVARATDLARQLITRYGGGGFPEPEALARAEPAEIGLPGTRGRAISGLARAVADNRVSLHEGVDATALTRALTAIPGIGPWTAAYIGMRVARDPDAFPDSDWVVLKTLGVRPAAARQTARAWRPWRAYAVMYLWWLAGHRRAETLGGRAGRPLPVEAAE